MDPLIKLIAGEDSQQDNGQHLEGHTGITGIVVKQPLLLVEGHLALWTMESFLSQNHP